MTRCHTLATAFVFSLLTLAFPADAVEFNEAEYHIYIGDLNSDGIDDIYLQEPDGLVLLHGDIVTPIVIPPDGPSYAILSNGSTYASPVEDNSVDVSNLTELTAGYAVYDQNGDSIQDLQVNQTGSLLYSVAIAGNSGSAPTLISITPPDAPPAPFNAIGNLATLIAAGDKNDTDEVGSVPGSFRVDESGAATYSIPVPTAVGTAGVVPQLSLNYSSAGGNGLMGLGWSIGGLSGITRCRQTLHQDRDPQPISWSAEDRFCLDGQRLLLETGANYGDVGATYKTEIDSFAKITSKGGAAGHPAYFKVERKDGSVSFYGNSADSKQQNTASPTAQTLTWAINKFQDSVGNPIWFIYTNDTDGHRISEVRYAYGSGDGPSGHNAKIVFGYGDRNDDISGYVSGYQFITKKRLTSVTSYNGTNELRRYDLTYLADLADIDSGTATIPNKLSRLASIEECVGTDCLPATAFDWVNPQAGFSSTADSSFQVASGGKNHLIGFKPADVNGDGIQDLVWLEAFVPEGSGDKFHKLRYALAESDGSGIQSISSFSDNSEYVYYEENYGTPMALDVLDYNADGRMDAIVYNDQSGIWKVYLASPQSDGSWKLSASPIDTPINNEEVLFADVNSDGLVDAVTDSTLRLLERNSNGNTSSQAYSFSSAITLDWPGRPFQNPPQGTFSGGWGMVEGGAIGDYDGNGKVDAILYAGRIYNCDIDGCATEMEYYAATLEIDQVNNTGDWSSITKIFELFSVNKQQINEPEFNAVDFNADGLADIKASYFASSDIYINKGESFIKQDVALLDINVDYNSDGYIDIAEHDDSAQKLKLSLWNSETNQFDTAINVLDASDDEDEAHLFFDTNGDGVTDYIRYLDEYFYTYLGQAGSQPKNVITKITNGLGAETDITYENLGQSDHYGRIDVSTSTECQPINYYGTYEYCTTTANDFYEALNGDWDVSDNHLEKYSPVLELHGPISVVTRVDSSAPKAGTTAGSIITGAKSAIEYHYREAKIQASGRGLLGFHSLITEDLQTGITTTTQYRQDWPFIGYPQRTEVRSAAGHLLSESENTWDVKNITDWSQAKTDAETSGTADLGALQPYISQSVEKTYSLNSNGASAGSLLQTVTTDNVYDNHGNPTQITVTTSGGSKNFQKITANEYIGAAISLTDHESSQSRAELGRLSKTTVTSKRDEDGSGGYELSQTRVSSFSYYTSGTKAGLLLSETLEPNNSVYTLVTTHSYDEHGNKVRAKTVGGGATRCDVDTADYDSDGRYIDTTYDCLGNKTSQVVSRNNYGEPTQIKTYIDTNGAANVSTHYAYTDRGIRYVEASSSGAWSGTTLHSGAGSYCPNGTEYHSKTQAAGGATGYECFDQLGRSVRTVKQGFAANDWVYQDTEYDNLGRVARKSEPSFGTPSYWTSLSYDILGRVTATVLPDGSDGSVTYNGYTTVTTNDKNQTKTETKNALGETLQVTDNLNGNVYYQYDAQGNMTHMCRAGSDCSSDPNKTVISYDLLGRKTAMNDPDKGDWSYDYNAFGELIEQTDAKGQVSELYYDSLGRLINRIDRCSANSDNCSANTIEGNTTWVYDIGANGLGQLHTVEDSISGYLKEQTYDSLGRPSKTLTSLSGSDGDHYEKITYDQYSRPHQVFDAARNDDTYTDNAIQYRYNARGYRDQIKDAVTRNGVQTVYQTIDSIDARGKVTGETRGNNVTTGMTYDAETGRITKIEALDSQQNDIQDLRYQWDTLGNLNYRHEYSGSKSLEETFTYDGLNRLKTYNVVGGPQKSLRYNSLGNIVYKSDVCSSSSDCYSYGSNAGPHAVTAINTTSAYAYDLNGNNTSGDGRNLKYTTFDKVKEVTKGNHTTSFAYAPDRSRYKRTDTNTSGTRTTLYIGSVEKITQPDGTKQTKRYIGGIAIITEHMDSNNTPTQLATLNYLYKDHLGSIDVITDNVGNIAQTPGGEQSFDAWGQRRNVTTWADITESVKISGFGVLANTDLITTRGFTGHEMVDEVGIIHMNGRIYDPKLGRFLQADPFVQSPTNTQSLNRYSYTLNNPLNATDPSGFFFKKLFKNKLFAAIVGIAAAFIAGGVFLLANGFASGAATGFLSSVAGAYSAAATVGAAGFLAGAGAIGGFVGGLISSGGDLKAALAGGLTGAIAGFIGGSSFFGQVGKLTSKRLLAHGILGGLSSEAQGGKFGHGFISAGISKIASGAIYSNIKDTITGAIASGIVGGTVSEISGGKFRNGATTGAFAYLFNQAATGKNNTKVNGTDEQKVDALKVASGVAQVGFGGAAVVGGAAATVFCIATAGIGCAALALGATALGAVSVVDGTITLNNELKGRNDLTFFQRIGDAFGGEQGRQVGQNIETATSLMSAGKGAARMTNLIEQTGRVPVGQATEAASDLLQVIQSDDQ